LRRYPVSTGSRRTGPGRPKSKVHRQFIREPWGGPRPVWIRKWTHPSGSSTMRVFRWFTIPGLVDDFPSNAALARREGAAFVPAPALIYPMKPSLARGRGRQSAANAGTINDRKAPVPCFRRSSWTEPPAPRQQRIASLQTQLLLLEGFRPKRIHPPVVAS